MLGEDRGPPCCVFISQTPGRGYRGAGFGFSFFFFDARKTRIGSGFQNTSCIQALGDAPQPRPRVEDPRRQLGGLRGSFAVRQKRWGKHSIGLPRREKNAGVGTGISFEAIPSEVEEDGLREKTTSRVKTTLRGRASIREFNSGGHFRALGLHGAIVGRIVRLFEFTRKKTD